MKNMPSFLKKMVKFLRNLLIFFENLKVFFEKLKVFLLTHRSCQLNPVHFTHTVASAYTYIRVSPHVYMHRATRTYASACMYICHCVRLRHILTVVLIPYQVFGSSFISFLRAKPVSFGYSSLSLLRQRIIWPETNKPVHVLLQRIFGKATPPM